MAEVEKQQSEESSRRASYRAALPGIQLRRFLTGERFKCGYCNGSLYFEAFHGRGSGIGCPVTKGTDIEPGMRLLREEYSVGKIIRLDKKTHDRLVDFAKPNEPILDLVNRLLDVAVEAQAAQIGEKTAVS
jgi:hypothetical protein